MIASVSVGTTAMASLGGGYQLTTADLTSFPSY